MMEIYNFWIILITLSELFWIFKVICLLFACAHVCIFVSLKMLRIENSAKETSEYSSNSMATNDVK